jgi:hypothetical protein
MMIRTPTINKRFLGCDTASTVREQAELMAHHPVSMIPNNISHEKETLLHIPEQIDIP